MLSAFAGPSRTTYQAKIIKPDGYPLEAATVNFKFTILDPVGTCILYSETYSSVNMTNTGGLISFALGSGVKTYPASATTFENVFSNVTPALSCDAGGPPIYSPVSTDTRKVVMQFHDGNGWQTLPAMSINAVPYAMYANDSLRLNGKTDTDFVQVSTLPMTCGASEALRFNGATFSCIAVGGSGSAVTSGAVITALGYTPGDGASITAITSSLNFTDSQVALVSSTVFSVSSTVSGLSNSVSTLTATTAASFTALTSAVSGMTSSQWVTSGSAISYNGGSIFVSGGVRIGTEATGCSPALEGTLRYNASNIEFCNGTSWSPFGIAGAGITNINGSASATQVFNFGISGIAPDISTSNGIHTFNIPFAASAGVTAGLLSFADYSSFTGKANAASVTTLVSDLAVVSSVVATKITSSAAAITETLGYVPASATALGNYVLRANNLSDLTSSAAARSNLGLGGFATVSSLDLGSASATGTIADARLLTQVGITSGTQYTKVTVDGKGRITSGAQLVQSDVTTALGYTPASASAASQWLTSGTTVSYNAGNVGIGTAGPMHPLHIHKAAGSDPNILLTDGDQTHPYSSVYSIIPANSVGYMGTSAGGGFNLYGFTSNNSAYGLSFNSYLGTTNPTGAALYFTGQKANGSGGGAQLSASETLIMVRNLNIPVFTLMGTGNLGLGLTPEAKFHLSAGTNTLAPMKFSSGTLLSSAQSGTIEYDGFNFYITDSTNTRRAIATASSSGTFDISNINSTGNVTLTPTASVVVSSTTASTNSATGALVVKGGLGVAGNIYSSGTIITSNNIQGSSITATSGIATNVIQGNSNLYLNPSGGNVGIGTTSTTAKLEVEGTIQSNTGGFLFTTQGRTWPKIGLYSYNLNNWGRGDLTFAMNNISDSSSVNINNEVMRLTSTGNLLIGTSDSTSILAVSGTRNGSASNITGIDFSPTLQTTATAGLTQTGLSVTPTFSDFQGVGSGRSLYVKGVADSVGVNATYALYVDAPTGGTANYAAVFNGGNVGIGTTTPSGPLSVSTTYTNTQINVNSFLPGISVKSSNDMIGMAMIDRDAIDATGNDRDAMIYFGDDTTDALRFSYAGSGQPVAEYMRITGSGNIGMGTVSPTEKLHVVGTQQIQNTATASGPLNGTYLTLDDQATSGRAGIRLRYQSAGVAHWNTGIPANVDAYTINGWGGNTNPEYFRISSTGNVGIGTSSPTQRLTIQATHSPATTTTYTGALLIHDEQNNVQPHLGFGVAYNGGNNHSWIQSNSASGTYPLGLNPVGGNVGIGTSNPGTTLDVNGNVTVGNGSASQTLQFRVANTDWGFIRLNSTSDAIGGSWLEIGTNDNGDEPITFTQAGTERMRIHTNGGLGVGTSAPASKLEVRSATTGALTSFTQTTANAGILIDTDIVNATHGPGVFWKASNSTPTKPKAGVWMYQENGPGSWLLFGTSNSYITGITNTAMAIDPSGYVGIGTTTPLASLYVVGGIRARGGAPGAGGVNNNGYAFNNGGDNDTGLFSSSDGLLQFYSDSAEAMRINQGGNVGIGGTPDDKFYVNNGTTIGRYTTGGWTHSSDRRMKHDINFLQGSLDKILQLRGVQYKFNKDPQSKTQLGFIAQEVEPIFPEVVETDKKGFKSMIYANLVAPVVESIKELFQRILGVEEKVQAQSREIAVLKEKSENLEQQNKVLKEYLCEKDPSAKICK